ncbi:hypothetical protein H6G89_15715 [Oscillatoria sp. FACHB-1407]|uniref:hypothetical protein n=1 Tax=Oscillatoria sp. FACHB-1407 TaxID=2692847 RepID=UPI001685A482|nr:hypothetical protein [Oscillatoria sp. FACHB-1407]MBD2462493.1 hypothetical protein [Oscillatoria sp. FACHB-1407]
MGTSLTSILLVRDGGLRPDSRDFSRQFISIASEFMRQVGKFLLQEQNRPASVRQTLNSLVRDGGLCPNSCEFIRQVRKFFQASGVARDTDRSVALAPRKELA